MATEDQVKQRTVSFIVLMVILLGGIAALGVLLLLLRRQITIAEVDVRGGVARLAWICAALIGLTLLLVAWATIRYVRFRLHPGGARPSPPHIDAWSVAGQRFKLDETQKDPGQTSEDSEP